MFDRGFVKDAVRLIVLLAIVGVCIKLGPEVAPHAVLHAATYASAPAAARTP